MTESVFVSPHSRESGNLDLVNSKRVLTFLKNNWIPAKRCGNDGACLVKQAGMTESVFVSRHSHVCVSSFPRKRESRSG